VTLDQLDHPDKGVQLLPVRQVPEVLQDQLVHQDNPARLVMPDAPLRALLPPQVMLDPLVTLEHLEHRVNLANQLPVVEQDHQVLKVPLAQLVDPVSLETPVRPDNQDKQEAPERRVSARNTVLPTVVFSSKMALCAALKNYFKIVLSWHCKRSLTLVVLQIRSTGQFLSI